MADSAADRDALYQQAAAAYSGAIERLARGYEPDPDKRRDLVQDIHVALWRSFAQFAHPSIDANVGLSRSSQHRNLSDHPTSRLRTDVRHPRRACRDSS
jgi:hypothetical protein